MGKVKEKVAVSLFCPQQLRRVAQEVFAVYVPKRQQRQTLADRLFLLRVDVPLHTGVPAGRHPGIGYGLADLLLLTAEQGICLAAGNEPLLKGRELHEQEGQLLSP